MKRLVALGLILCVLLAASASHAFTIRGKLKNGTTGSTNVSAHVVALQPSAGMKEAATADAKNGEFVLENLPDDSPFFLLRTDYNGVIYNTPIQPSGGDQTVEIEVFEPTQSWEGVNITVPHLATVRRGNELHVEQLFEITNESTPPKTVNMKDGAFRLFLPADMDSLTDCTVASGEMPIKRVPIPTSTPDIFSIDYPIRPGMTRISVSYAVPYAAGSYTMTMRFAQPVARMTIFAVDSSMQVTSTTHELGGVQSVHGMSAYALADLKTNSQLALTFFGGDPEFAGIDVEGEEHDHGAAPENIRVSPTDDYKFAIFLMVTVLMVLAGIVAMALRERRDPLSDPQILRGHYTLLVARLAKLDDLHAANTIPDDAYRAAREELMGRLAALAMQLRAHGGVHAPDKDALAEPRSRAQ